MPKRMWILVPARGGSKGIPRKNLKPLCGKPLVSHVLDRLSTDLDACGVVLSTDRREIANLAPQNTLVHFRSGSNSDDKATLDDVAVEVSTWLLTHGAKPNDFLITVQPTSPWIKASSIEQAYAELDSGSGSVLSVRDDRHLRWAGGTEGDVQPLYSARVNRQSLPEEYAETGGFIGARISDILEQKTRIVSPISLLALPDEEAVDIDTPADWALAEHYGTRLNVVVRADANATLGTGHVRRAIALANELRVAGHSVVVVSRSDESSLASRLLEGSRIETAEIETNAEFSSLLQDGSFDIAILDVLDTSVEQVEGVRDHVPFVVSFEDLGAGRRLCDLVVNHLYPTPRSEANVLSGVSTAILAPEFESVSARPPANSVERILLAFGGSDPSNLTSLALKALSITRFAGEVEVLVGPGFAHEFPDLEACGLRGRIVSNPESVLDVMSTADLAITSAGRTVTELMHLGVPTIAMCQNVRELSHSHATSTCGVLNLGLGTTVATETLAAHIDLMLNDSDFRGLMSARMLEAVEGRTNAGVVDRILQVNQARTGDVLQLMERSAEVRPHLRLAPIAA